MFKKITLLMLLSCMLLVPMTVYGAKDYVAERFDVDILLGSDGSMQVTETIAFRFMGGPFTYAYRDLEKTNTDGITFISAGLDGMPLPVNGESAIEWVEVKDGDPLNVTWHFAPTTDQTRVYTLSYQVDGVVRKNETDDIIWMAIPPEHEYRVQESRIAVTYPSAVVLANQPQLSGATSSLMESEGNPIVITTGPVEANTPLVLTLNYASGTLVSSPPAWQLAEAAQAERTAKTIPFAVGGFTFILVGLISALVVLAIRQDPLDEPSSPASPSKPVSPPTDYRPALAGALAERGNATIMHSLAALIDLAQRGFISIEQVPGKLFNPHRFELVRLPKTEDLAMHEQVLMDALFIKSGQPVERMGLEKYAELVSKSSGEFAKAVKTEIGLLGLISPVRKKKQSRLLVSGACMILAGVVIGLGLAAGVLGRPDPLSVNGEQLIYAVLGSCAGSFMGGLVYLIFAAIYSPLNSQGRWIASQWNGFSGYLRDIIARRVEPLRPDAFTQFLPFATGFGLGPSWAKSFQERGFTDVPAWFHALNAQDAMASYGAFTAFMASSNSSATSSGGGAAGGASGGGGSGAG